MKDGYFETRRELVLWYMDDIAEAEDDGRFNDARRMRQELIIKLAQFDRGERVHV